MAELKEISGSERELALVDAALELLKRYSGADGGDSDEEIDAAFDALSNACDPYVREQLGLPTSEVNNG